MKKSLVAFLLALSLSSCVAEDHTEEKECSVYLAESSVKNGGWGVFAGKDYARGERIGHPGLGVHVLESHELREELLSKFLTHTAKIGGFSESARARTFLPGLHSLVNYHSTYANVIEGGLTRTSTHRYEDPMAGGYTNYHGFNLIANSQIRQGQEMFLEGNPEWFQESKFPQRSEFERARKIVAALFRYHQKFPDLTEEHWIDILYRLKTEMLQDVVVAKVLPSTLEELVSMAESGVEAAEIIPRHFDWVRENGYCLDNIREGTSTVEGAGRGAFATRMLEEGSIIAPAPLLHVMDSSVLDFDRAHTNATTQLLLNYCFGHKESQVLLCPTTHVTLINHNATATNAEIRWSKPSQNRLDADINYRARGLDEILSLGSYTWRDFNAKLAFEVVATKQIDVGEEIFLDYGSEWEHALLEHTRQWIPPSESGYTPPKEMNKMDEAIVLSRELPSYYSYECSMEPLAQEREYLGEAGHDYFSPPYISPEHWDSKFKRLYGENDFVCWYPCHVFALNDDGTYQADAFSKVLPLSNKIRRWKNIPRGSIRFADAHFQSDQHLPSAFRHFIPIPDKMVPFRWRGDYATAASLHLGQVDLGIDLALPENQESHDIHEVEVRSVKCGVYFAPSNVPNAGFGTYTAVPLVGRGVVVGTTLPAIPVSIDSRQWSGMDYNWQGKTFFTEFETAGANDTNVLAVNDGALANSHQGLVNENLASSRFHPALDRCKDPGAGAFSDYIHYSFKSSFALGAGEELFVDYGESWFVSRDDFADVPLGINWMESNTVLASLWTLSQLQNAELGIDQTMTFLDLVKETVVDKHRTRMALESVGSIDDLRRVIERNGTAAATMEIRTQEWFDEHGHCLDHVYVKESTISQAGAGGFSRRFLKDGTVVISAPLITTFGEDMMRLNTTKANSASVGMELNDHILFLNYQFSHPDSSVYFFPINHAFIFNHNSERMPGGVKPNARMRWASWNKKSNYVLRRPLEDLEKERYSTIVLDIVATRDIQVDEEIFIDYGPEWESAWQEHLASWESPCKDSNVMSSMMVYNMNFAKFDAAHHQWSDDHMSVCSKTNDDLEWIHLVKVGEVVPSITKETVLTSFRGIEFDHRGFDYSLNKVERFPCVIIDADPFMETFEVAYFKISMESRIPELPTARILQIHRKLPAIDLTFINRPFRGDMHWKGAFRHPIKIPDEVFPAQWRDLA